MIIQEKHSLGLVPITLSKLIERISYYGMRTIILVYMTRTVLAFSHVDAVYVYGMLVLAAGLLPLVGGLLGDLVFGVRLASIIGLAIQAAGCFILAIPSVSALYTGLSLISLGTGLYSPNIISALGIIYREKKKLMDAAMYISYIIVNIGAFTGSFIMGALADDFSFSIAFIACGILPLISMGIIIASDKSLAVLPKKANIYLSEQTTPVTMKIQWRILSIILVLIALPLFWLMTGSGSNSLSQVCMNIEEQLHLYPFTMLLGLVNPAVTIIIGIILSIVWTFVDLPSLLKLFIGFIIFSLACFLSATIVSSAVSNSTVSFIVTTTALQAIAELFIAPVALSYICQYGPVKFNSTLIAASSALSYLFSAGTSFLIMYTKEIPYGFINCVFGIIMLLVAAIFLTFHLLTKEEKSKQEQTL